MRWSLLLICVLFLFGGALGLVSPQECDIKYARDAPRMQCYHSAAITAAYLCGTDRECPPAQTICYEIWDKFKGSASDNNDLRRRAEITYQACFLDIAKILRNPDLCGKIMKRDDLKTKLVGDTLTRKVCIDEATKLAQLDPDNFFINNRDSICVAFYVLPLLLFFSHKPHP